MERKCGVLNPPIQKAMAHIIVAATMGRQLPTPLGNLPHDRHVVVGEHVQP